MLSFTVSPSIAISPRLLVYTYFSALCIGIPDGKLLRPTRYRSRFPSNAIACVEENYISYFLKIVFTVNFSAYLISVHRINTVGLL